MSHSRLSYSHNIIYDEIVFKIFDVLYSAPVIEEPKEPVDPAVRAKQNWLRLYNKVLDQLREVSVSLNPGHELLYNTRFKFQSSFIEKSGLSLQFCESCSSKQS